MTATVDPVQDEAFPSSPNPAVESMHAKQYGDALSAGFKAFQISGEFSDIVVSLQEGSEYHLHSLLLASRSEFFHTAFTSDFVEGRQRRLELQLERGKEAWPCLVDYFYTGHLVVDDSNVLPLMALARQLLIPSVDGFCGDFVAERLSVSNCISYLRSAVALQLDELQRDCITLVARGAQHVAQVAGFPYLYNADVAGLPPSSVVDILQHADLVVHCELQVLEFVQRYLGSTHADVEAVRAVCGQVRYAYLDNASIAAVAQQGQVPQDILHTGLLARITYMDKPDLDHSSMVPPPRPTYCCSIAYSLPGGTTHVDMDMESVWDALVPCMTARASGCAEGHPSNLLSADPDAWFWTDDSHGARPWVEVLLPRNVAVTSLVRYTYGHGHRRANYYRMRNFKTQVCEKLGGTYVDLPTRVTESCEVQTVLVPGVSPPLLSYAATAAAAAAFDNAAVASAVSGRPFQALRVLSTGTQDDNVCRLCIRNLRMYGRISVDLMAQHGGFAVTSAMVQASQVLQCSGTHSDGGSTGSSAGGWGTAAPAASCGGGSHSVLPSHPSSALWGP